jgi:hypothetical protein
VDGDLLAAVTVRAAERGETVTDVIIQRFRAYIRDDEAAGIVSAPPVSEPPVYTPPESPEEPACRHPAEAVEAGECGICHADVW